MKEVIIQENLKRVEKEKRRLEKAKARESKEAVMTPPPPPEALVSDLASIASALASTSAFSSSSSSVRSRPTRLIKRPVRYGIAIEKEIKKRPIASTSTENSKRRRAIICVCQQPRDKAEQELKCISCGNLYHAKCVSSSTAPFQAYECLVCTQTKKRDTLFCLCQKSYDENDGDMVECETCNEWFHLACLNIEADDLTKEAFSCTSCDENKIFCYCNLSKDDGTSCVKCSKCSEWFHCSCVGISEDDADALSAFFCTTCQVKIDHYMSEIDYTQKAPK